jgi:hypothetical protein
LAETGHVTSLPSTSTDSSIPSVVSASTGPASSPNTRSSSNRITQSNGSHVDILPVATLRHVSLEPIAPLDNLGIRFKLDPNDPTKSITVEGFMPVAMSGTDFTDPKLGHTPVTTPAPMPRPDNAVNELLPIPPGESLVDASAKLHPYPVFVAGAPHGPGVVEESDLVQVGDVVLGVSGICTIGMSIEQLSKTITAARAVTPGGLVVLHLCNIPIDHSLVDEATLQIASAAESLLNSKDLLENIRASVMNVLLASQVPIPILPQMITSLPGDVKMQLKRREFLQQQQQQLQMQQQQQLQQQQQQQQH